eukprot:164571-Pleurochrysis_carterae.AAC.5
MASYICRLEMCGLAAAPSPAELHSNYADRGIPAQTWYSYAYHEMRMLFMNANRTFFIETFPCIPSTSKISAQQTSSACMKSLRSRSPVRNQASASGSTGLGDLRFVREKCCSLVSHSRFAASFGTESRDLLLRRHHQ